MHSFIYRIVLCLACIGVWCPLLLTAQRMPVELVPSTGNEDQDYGYSVALDGNVAVVGAFRDEDGFNLETGAAFVFRYDNGAWAEEAKLQASSIASLNWFGWDVAISGDVLLSTTRFGDLFTFNGGEVTVFRRTGGSWQEETILIPEDGIGGDYGFAVAVDGDVAAIGAPSRNGAVASTGAVYVYRYNGSEWIEEDLLEGSDLSLQALFGSDIVIEGDRMLISAFNADDSTSNQAGKLYIFDYDGAGWNESAVLQSNSSNNIANLGVSVDLEGEWAVGGAPLDNELRGGAGAAFVYRFDGSTWNFHSKLTASDGVGFYLFGSSVALSGNRLLVTADNWAAPGEGSTGKAYLFEYNEVNDAWEEIDSFVPAGVSTGSSFGHAATMQGDVMLIGAPEHSGAMEKMGAAYIYGTPTVATSVDRPDPESGFLVSAPFPNPFSYSASVSVTPGVEGLVRISLFDVLGRNVKEIFEGVLPGDTPTTISFSVDNLPDGLYWVQVHSGNRVQVRPVMHIGVR